jgi:hypothetical protein
MKRLFAHHLRRHLRGLNVQIWQRVALFHVFSSAQIGAVDGSLGLRSVQGRGTGM